MYILEFQESVLTMHFIRAAGILIVASLTLQVIIYTFLWSDKSQIRRLLHPDEAPKNDAVYAVLLPG
jgi:hypothetical protein